VAQFPVVTGWLPMHEFFNRLRHDIFPCTCSPPSNSHLFLMNSVDSRIDIDQRRADTSPVFVLDSICLPTPQLLLIKRPFRFAMIIYTHLGKPFGILLIDQLLLLPFSACIGVLSLNR